MERSGGSVAALSANQDEAESSRGASLSIRLSAVIVTATVDEPRVLTVQIGEEPIEALPSGPLEVEHRTLEVGLRAWVERTEGRRIMTRGEIWVDDVLTAEADGVFVQPRPALAAQYFGTPEG